MKLFYYKDPNGNFGDDLNPWLWPRLLDGCFNEDDSNVFVGIGTLINNKLPNQPIKHIFGSGVGYGAAPIVDDKYIFHALRGFLSAKVLGQSKSLVITDAAILINVVLGKIAADKTHKIGFMPTGEACRNYDWNSICDELGFCFISPHCDVMQTISKITSCEVLICEAMHGAIVADALRIPWIPVDCYRGVLKFKWEDWLSSLDLPYEPKDVPSLFRKIEGYGFKDIAKLHIKRSFRRFGVWSDAWTPPPHKESTDRDRDQVISILTKIASTQTFLSDDSIHDSLISRYLELIASFKASYGN